MSFVAEKKKCSKCGRLYSWNPDVGKIQCPYCKKKREQGNQKSQIWKAQCIQSYDYHESLNKAYETNASSVESYYHACSTMIEALQKKMEQDGFSFDEIKYIIERQQDYFKVNVFHD